MRRKNNIMRKWKLPLFSLLLVSVCYLMISSFKSVKRTEINQEVLLTKILKELGDPIPEHILSELDTSLVRMGRDIVFEGRTIDKQGKRSKRQSKFFVCTSCHNTVQEDPDLTESNPVTRLDYASNKSIPFLQGSTFFGIVNRETWYNDDYLKKYGELVKPARDTLVNAIQLCAIECSQGRLLEDWELEAVLTYFNSLAYKLSDLNLSSKEINALKEVCERGSLEDKRQSLGLLKAKYLQKSPATFLPVPNREERKYGEGADIVKGKKIYDLSCLHCHDKGGAATYKLDYSPLTFQQLKKNLRNYSDKSVYQIVRMGTYAMPGYKPYMPHYPQERMSKDQLEDLVGFIVARADRQSN